MNEMDRETCGYHPPRKEDKKRENKITRITVTSATDPAITTTTISIFIPTNNTNDTNNTLNID